MLGLRDGDRETNGRALLPRGRCGAHEVADEVLHHLPLVEAAFAPDEVVADAGEGNDIDPDGVVAGLLEGGRGERRRDVELRRVESRVVVDGTTERAGGWVGEPGV